MPMRGGGAAASALGAIALGTLAYGTLVERNAFTVRHETVPVLEAGARPVTVLHLSDIHMAPWQRSKQEWIAGLTAWEPDLIVNTGDNLGHADGIDGIERALKVFDGVPGVFVNGSNDYFGPVVKSPFTYFTGPSKAKRREPDLDTDRLESYFEGLGWLSLNNVARAMSMKGSRLEFVGVNDPHIGYDRLDRVPGALDDLRENVAWADTPGPDPVTVGVAHAPYRRVLNSLVNNGADVIFAGHTHGGQVRVPGVGALVTNSDLPRDRASGLSVWTHAMKSSYLEVSAGLGTSIYAPVRFACRPEAVVVTLTGDDIGYSG